MPIVTLEKYREVLDAASDGGCAIPAINVTSSSTLLAAFEGFTEAGSDSVIQVSYGGGQMLLSAGNSVG